MAKITVKIHDKLNQSSSVIHADSSSTQCSEEALRNQRLASQLPEIIAPRTAWGDYNVMRNVPQGHRNFNWNSSPILSKIPDIFNQTEWKGTLRSSWLLNM